MGSGEGGTPRSYDEELVKLTKWLCSRGTTVAQFFEWADVDDSGEIDIYEFANALRASEIADLPPWDTKELIKVMDINSDGLINLPELDNMLFAIQRDLGIEFIPYEENDVEEQTTEEDEKPVTNTEEESEEETQEKVPEEGGLHEYVVRQEGNVVGGDINTIFGGDVIINHITSETKSKSEISMIPEAFQKNEKELTKFIGDHWLKILEKHTTEKITLKEHSKIVSSLFIEIYSFHPEHKSFRGDLRVQYSIAEKICNHLMSDNRILKSPVMLSELYLVLATISSKKIQFEDFKSNMDSARSSAKLVDSIEDDITLDIYQEISDWWHQDTMKPIDMVDELCADLIVSLSSSGDFLENNGDWLLRICEQNSNGFSYPEIFRFVRLDRYLENEMVFMFENILQNNTFSIEQFERFCRLMFDKNIEYFSDSKDYYQDTERMNFMTYSIHSIQSKMSTLKDNYVANRKIECWLEFWNWFELLAFILTVKQSKFHDKSLLRVQESRKNDNTSIPFECHHIFGELSKFFSHSMFQDPTEPMKLKKPVPQSLLKVFINCRRRVFGAINAINATYCGSYLPNGMLRHENQLGFYVDQLFDFGQTDFGISWLYSSLGKKSFSMEPEYMPRWWVGSPCMDANPDFEATYLEWEKGKSISDIELPLMPQNPEKKSRFWPWPEGEAWDSREVLREIVSALELVRKGMLDEASATIDALGPHLTNENVDLILHIGMVLKHLDRTDEVKSMLAKANAVMPGNEHVASAAAHLGV